MVTTPAAPARRDTPAVVDEIERTRPTGTGGPVRPYTTTVDGPGRSALDVRLDGGGGAVAGRAGNGVSSVTVDGGGVTVGGGYERDDAGGDARLNGTVVVAPDGTSRVHVDGSRTVVDGEDRRSVNGALDVGPGTLASRGGITLARRERDGTWRTFEMDGRLAVSPGSTSAGVSGRRTVDGPGGATDVRFRADARTDDAGNASLDGRVDVTRRGTDGTTTTVDAAGALSRDRLSGDVRFGRTGPGGGVSGNGSAVLRRDGGRVAIGGDRTVVDDAGERRTGGGVAVDVDAGGTTVDLRGERTVTGRDGSGHAVNGGVVLGPDGRARLDGRGTATIVGERTRGTVGVDVSVDHGPGGTSLGGGARLDGRRDVDDGADTLTVDVRGGTGGGAGTVGGTARYARDRRTTDGSTSLTVDVDGRLDAGGASGRATVRHVDTGPGGGHDVTVSVDGRGADARGSHTVIVDGASRTVGGSAGVAGGAVRGDVSITTIDPVGRRRDLGLRFDVDAPSGRTGGGISGRREGERVTVGGDVSVTGGGGGPLTTDVRGEVTTVVGDHTVTVDGGATVVSDPTGGATTTVRGGVRDRVVVDNVETITHVNVDAGRDRLTVDAGRSRRDLGTGDTSTVAVRGDVLNGRGDLTLGGMNVDGDRRVTDEGTVGVTGSGVAVRGRRDVRDADGARTYTGGLEVGGGTSSARGGRTNVTDRASITTDGAVATGDGQLDLSVAHRHSLATPTERVSFGVAVGGRQTLKVRDEGAVTGGVLDGLHRVSLEYARGADVGVGGGLAFGIVNVGGGVRGGHDRGVSYVTHKSADDAARASRGELEVTLPDLAAPDKLALGDAITVRRAGRAEISLDASLLGIGASGRASTEGEFEFTVQKVGAERVRVTLQPSSIERMSIDGRAIVLHAAIEGERAGSLTQSYELDLSTEAGRRAYAAAIDGELPAVDVKKVIRDVESSVDVIERLNATLPEGVRAIRLGTEDAWRTSVSVSASWAFLNLGRDERWRRVDRRTVEDGRVVAEHESARESISRTWFSGQESKGVYSAVSQLTERAVDGAVTTTFRALSLGARLGDTEVEKDDLDDMLDDLREKLGVPMPLTGYRGVGEARTVDVNLVLDAARLETLSRRAIETLEDAAAHAGADRLHARELESRLLRSTSAADRACAMQDFVARTGLAGLGTLVRSFKDVEVAITASDTGDEARIADAEQAIARHRGRLRAGDAEAYLARFSDLFAHRRFVTRAHRAVAADPFLDDARRAPLLARLDALDRSLDELLDVSDWSFLQRTMAIGTITGRATLATNTMAFEAVRFLEHGEDDG